MFLFHDNSRSKIKYNPNQSIRHVYDSMNDSTVHAPYFFASGWQKLERYHKFSDIPENITEIHWQSEPTSFSSWGEDKLVTIILYGYLLRMYVRNLDTTLQRLYNKTHAWTTNNPTCYKPWLHQFEKPFQGDMYDKNSGEKLELNKLLLDVDTRIFEIK